MSQIRIKDLCLLKCRDGLTTLPQGKVLINTINAHSYNMARRDCLFSEALLKGDVLIPDGASIVLAFRFLRREVIERITGWDLFTSRMKMLNAKSIDTKTRGKVFFLGSSDSVLIKIRERVATEYTHLDVYTFSPPFKTEFSEIENKQMIEAVNVVRPDLLWIGMTAPKQEKWIYTHIGQLHVNGPIGAIGAVFDFYAGTVKRAPLWWQEHNMEWCYRLIKEPKRMWKRYLVGNFLFLINIIRYELK